MQREIKRKQKRKYKALIIVLAVICLILSGIAIVNSMRITKIEVSGNKQYTREEIIQILFDEKKEYNMAYVYYKDKMKDHERIPFVQDYKLIFNSLNELEVIIYEKSMVGCILYMDSYMYFDKDGMIVESSSEQIEGIPLVSGLKFEQVVLFQELKIDNPKIFENLLNLTQMLGSNEIIVDKVYLDNNLYATLYIGGLKVTLGGNSQWGERILLLKDLLHNPKLTGLSGTLNLNKENDSGNGIYSFNKD